MRSESLSTKTLAFWNLSQGGVTTTEAIHICNDILDALGPRRTLRYRVTVFQNRVIVGKSRKKPPLRNNVTPIRSVARVNV